MNIDAEIAPPELFIQDQKKLKQIENIIKGLNLNWKTVQRVKIVFEDELEKGLREEPSSLQMENTYVPEVPDGTEEGKYMALDLGGTNFRILLAELRAGQITVDSVQNYEIPEKLRLGPGADLFDFIAESVKRFLRERNMPPNVEIPLGFTFSFPMAQHSLSCGVLIKWTKTFKCSDVVGKDVVQLLNSALRNKGCSNVHVKAIINDSTGTLMMGALLDRKTSIGLIVGTGSNACYMEKADRVRHWETVRHGEKEVVIDVEWGAFGDNGVLNFIKTGFDVQVDENSLLVNSFTFEKYISGKYLGEIVRVVLVKLVEEGLLFGGKLSDILNTPHLFASQFISEIEEDILNDKLNNTLGILSQLEIKHYSLDDVKLLQHVCRVVANRSALLVAICLSVLLERIGKKEVTIAVDGSVFTKHPSYQLLLEKFLGLMTKTKFKFLGVSDGSGKGAAVVVAIATKLDKRFSSKEISLD